MLAVAAAAIFPCCMPCRPALRTTRSPVRPRPLEGRYCIQGAAEVQPEFQPIYTRLKQKRVLEQLQQFLAPLKLKRNLEVMTAECQGSFYLPYKPQGPVTICYEFVQLIDTMADDRPWGIVGSSVVTRDMFTVGPFVQEVLHNVALAVFDIQEIPVWGNAEFAADNVAAFLMLQFGTDVAMKTVLVAFSEPVGDGDRPQYVRLSGGHTSHREAALLQSALCGLRRRSDQVRQLHSHQSPGAVTDLSIDRANRCVLEYAPLKRSIHHDHPESARGSGVAQAGARHEMA